MQVIDDLYDIVDGVVGESYDVVDGAGDNVVAASNYLFSVKVLHIVRVYLCCVNRIGYHLFLLYFGDCLY